MVPSKPKKRKTADSDLGAGGAATTSRGQARELAAKRLKQEQDDTDKAKAALDARRKAAEKTKRVPEKGARGDDKLHMAFIKVGQGDCIVVATPGGKVLLFDCGTFALDGETRDEFLKRVKSVLRNPKFLKGSDRIEALILSHADGDHYNRLQGVLGADYVLGACYYSGDWDHYSGEQANAWVLRQLRDVRNRMKVVLNHDPPTAPGQVTLNDVAVPAATPAKTTDVLDPKGGIRIIDEPNCTISIVAAGVIHEYQKDASEEKNRGSIVTLIEAFGSKILICGDATVNTEKFLLNTTGTRLQDLTVLQIGHHGSVNTSSSQVFADRVNPLIAIASAGMNVPKNGLPSKPALDRYVAKMASAGRAVVGEHETGCWEDQGAGRLTAVYPWYVQEVYTTGSYDTFHLTYPAAVAP